MGSHAGRGARAAVLVLLLVWMGSVRVGLGAEGDRVFAELTGAATPYETVRFEIAERRGTVIVSTVKTFANQFGHEQRVGLLPKSELGPLFEALDRLNAFEIPSRQSRSPRTRWHIELRRGRRSHRIVVDSPGRLADRRYARVLSHIRSVVAESAGIIPFRDALLLPTEAGLIRLDSTPRAGVAVDGIELGLVTPVVDLRLPAGPHEIRLNAIAEPLSRTYEVRVEVGKTTQLVVDLH